MKYYQDIPCQGVVCNYGVTDRFKTEFLSVDFILPLTTENATGMSLLAGVLHRGCRKFPGMDLIGRYLSRHYGAAFSISASKAGEMEILSFSFNYLNNEYAIDGEDIRTAIIDLFSELVFNPLVENDSFKQELVEQEKANLSDKIIGLFNDKRVYSLERCKELMCSDEPYGICEMGSREIIEQFDEKNLYDFFIKMINEAHVILSYVGKEKKYFLRDLALKFGARNVNCPETSVRFSSGSVNEVVESMDLNQSKLNMGYRFGENALNNGSACRLFNVIFGGSATSKLFLNVREKLSLCYYCSSNIDRFKNVMFVSSGIEASKYAAARKEIEAQLASIVAGDFSNEEFENAKKYLIDSIKGYLDSGSALAALMTAGTLRGDLKTPEQEAEDISGVTREEVIAIAKDVSLDTVYFLKGVHDNA